MMSYRSTGIRRHGNGFAIDGELTVRSVTRPAWLACEVNWFRARSRWRHPGRFHGNRRGLPPQLRGLPATPIVGLASAKVHIGIEATVVLRRP